MRWRDTVKKNTTNSSEGSATPIQPLKDQDRAAEFLGGISTRTLEAWRSQGKGPRFVRVGKRAMYRPEDLAAFVEANTRTSTRDAA
jgi:hypothetical protein